MRASQINTAPVKEPVTLAEAKDHLRVTWLNEDLLIERLIGAARTYVENYTHRFLITQTWESRFDCFADRLELPGGNLQSVTSVQYVDGNGTLQTASSSLYDLDTFGTLGSIRLAYGQSWPGIRYEPQAVRVTFVAGYGDTSDDVPQQLRHAMLMMISNYYEQRESFVVGLSAAAMPAPLTVEALLGPYRIAQP